jgi:hypothetical protein
MEHMSIRSLVGAGGVGLLIGVAVNSVFGQHPSIPPYPQGRYQIVFSPHLRADTYLLDTETGRVWQPIVHTSLQGDPIAWDLRDRLDTDAEREEFRKIYPPKVPK